MEYRSFNELNNLCLEPETLDATVVYLSERLRQFLRPQDRVLFCFGNTAEGTAESLLLRALAVIDAKVLTLNGDYRWINILKTAFNTRANVIFGLPLVILGVTKLARYTNTPLFFRHVFSVGAPCLDWMIEGIRRGLDCVSWGCFDPLGGSVIAGFSCSQGEGIHIREDCFDVSIENDAGDVLADGELGNVVLTYLAAPTAKYSVPCQARMLRTPCECGCTSAKLVDLFPSTQIDPELIAIGQELYSWTSVLDCNVYKGENGLEIDLVVFPGSKLPQLPFCAKKTVRFWNPDKDIPVSYRIIAEKS